MFFLERDSLQKTVRAEDKCLSRLLTFAPEIEQEFEQCDRAERTNTLVRGGLIGIALYDLFLIYDWQLVPDVFLLACFFRLGVFTPLMVLTICIPPRSHSVLVREGAWCAMLVLRVILPMCLVDTSASVHVTDCLYGAVLVMAFATAVQRLRFRFAAVSNAGTFAVVTIGIFLCGAFDMRMRLAAITFYLVGAALLTTAAYALDRERRLGFIAERKARVLNAELDRMSKVDPLTSLWNRRYLVELMNSAWQELRPETSLAVVLLDVDHFKQFNDIHGHSVGDACLAAVGRCLAELVTPRRGAAVRYGGEEFLAFLPGFGEDAAVALAEELRRAVRNLAVPLENGGTAPVTTSIGVAAELLSQSRPSLLIKRADEALYAAKRDGRDQVARYAASLSGSAVAAAA